VGSPRTRDDLFSLIPFRDNPPSPFLDTTTSRALLLPFLHYHRSNIDTRSASATMVQNQGIDVYLAPFRDINERYQQHGVPLGSPAFTNDPNEVYIQAVDGERFMIVVDFMEYFDMKGAEHLYIRPQLDTSYGGETASHYCTLSDLKKRLSRGTDLEGRYTHKTSSRKIDGTWTLCGVAFASLTIGNAYRAKLRSASIANNRVDEELDMDADEVAREADIHGKIVVTVQRGNLVKKPESSNPGVDVLWNGYEAPDTKVSSKNVVKDNHVSHAIR
jgi:hypothetical protein